MGNMLRSNAGERIEESQKSTLPGVVNPKMAEIISIQREPARNRLPMAPDSVRPGYHLLFSEASGSRPTGKLTDVTGDESITFVETTAFA
jgi:hypothetical protein